MPCNDRGRPPRWVARRLFDQESFGPKIRQQLVDRAARPLFDFFVPSGYRRGGRGERIRRGSRWSIDPPRVARRSRRYRSSDAPRRPPARAAYRLSDHAHSHSSYAIRNPPLLKSNGYVSLLFWICNGCCYGTVSGALILSGDPNAHLFVHQIVASGQTADLAVLAEQAHSHFR